MGVGGQHHAPGRFIPGKDPVHILQEAGWAPGPVWTGAENLASSRDSIPRTVQPVASRYTDWAIPADCEFIYGYYKLTPKHLSVQCLEIKPNWHWKVKNRDTFTFTCSQYRLGIVVGAK